MAERPTMRDIRVDTTTVRDLREGPAAGRLCLLVIGDGLFATYPLPDGGEVSLGRAEGNQIRIDDPSISRRHAILHLGDPLRIEDLGSANGTRVRGERIAADTPTPMAAGEVVDLGTAMIIVQQRGAPTRPRRLWTHGYFEGRLEDECARAEGGNARFAVVRIHCDSGVPSDRVQDVLAELLAPADVVGAYGPGEYELLLVDSEPGAARELLGRIAGRLATEGIPTRTGIACWPADGRGPDELVARACAEARGEPAAEPVGDGVIVIDGAMQQLHRLVQRIAAGSISVLLLGETGVGKEVMAEAVHRYSPRRDKPFLGLSCAALSESLLESELFGYEKGAFTGAQQVKPGLLETADGGTVFLDEIGELPAPLQVKLLRVLEERKVLRVGGLRPRPIDVRFVAATNRDLEAEVARGGFRQDLYYRLNGVSLVIPPLRERVGEILPLARTFVALACRQAGLARESPLGREVVPILERYSWPGNIRELRNVMERAVLLAGDAPILPEHLPLDKMRAIFTARVPASAAPLSPPSCAAAVARSPGAADTTAELDLPTSSAIDDAERQRILDALQQCAGNQTRAAKVLGFSRRTLLNRLDAMGVIRPRKGQE